MEYSIKEQEMGQSTAILMEIGTHAKKHVEVQEAIYLQW
jgi:hypothetical protein